MFIFRKTECLTGGIELKNFRFQGLKNSATNQRIMLNL